MSWDDNKTESSVNIAKTNGDGVLSGSASVFVVPAPHAAFATGPAPCDTIGVK